MSSRISYESQNIEMKEMMKFVNVRRESHWDILWKLDSEKCQIDSVKTASMENVNTGVLDKK